MGKVSEVKCNGNGLRVGVMVRCFNSMIIERAGTKAGNKGAEAAESLIGMVNVLCEIQ